MDPEPTNEAERKVWAATPIFRTTGRDGKVRRCDRATYRKAWANTLAVVVQEHPELAGMVVRDFRPTFRTHLTDARVPEPLIRRLMGHAVDVSQGYYELTDAKAEQAILELTIPEAEADAGENGNRVATPCVSIGVQPEHDVVSTAVSCA